MLGLGPEAVLPTEHLSLLANSILENEQGNKNCSSFYS